MWNDIDLYHAVRDFTTDPVSFPAEEVRSLIQDLVCPRAIPLPMIPLTEVFCRRLTISTISPSWMQLSRDRSIRAIW